MNENLVNPTLTRVTSGSHCDDRKRKVRVLGTSCCKMGFGALSARVSCANLGHPTEATVLQKAW